MSYLLDSSRTEVVQPEDMSNEMKPIICPLEPEAKARVRDQRNHHWPMFYS